MDTTTELADDPFAIHLPARPYPGLRPFDMAEWPIFFGRERMVDAVVTRLVTDRFIVVHGDSGSGKSSLIRAGVLPRLLQDQARGGARWRTCIALPRGGPLRNLAQALAALDGRGDDAQRVLDLRRALNLGRHTPAALAEAMLSGPDDHLCVLIDQFEELFEHARQPGGEAEARGLTDALVALAESPPRGLYVALTMRSEYLGNCARFPGLAEAVNQRQYLLPPMVTTDLLRAIREPATLFDGEVEPALAEHLAADALGIDGLPLVQHALMLMHRNAVPAGQAGAAGAAGAEAWRLKAADYPAEGLGALLSAHADGVAAAAGPAGQPRLVEDMMRALTAVNAEGHAVRRPLPLARLAQLCDVTPAVLRPVIDAFRADGVSLMTPGQVPGHDAPLPDDAWIDIGHEALIRSWRRLAEPQDGWLVNEFRNGLVWRSLLVQADSFEREQRNVLSPTTTDERASWMQRRNPAWAERYGGGWDRVQALIAASQTRAEEARRQELEAARERLRADENRSHAWRASIVAGFSIALALLAAWQWYRASSISEALTVETGKANQSNRDLQKALAAATAERNEAVAQQAVAESNGVRLQNALANYDRVVKDLEQALAIARATPGYSASERAALNKLETSVRQLGAETGTTAAQNGGGDREGGPANGNADPAPRLYVHIGVEGQRSAAEAFRRLMGRNTLDSRTLAVPGVQLVPGQRNDGVLRCFRAAECRDEAPKVLAMANALLASPVLTLQDLSTRYTSNPPRPHHFEVWFGPGPVTLSAQGTAAAAAADGGKKP